MPSHASSKPGRESRRPGKSAGKAPKKQKETTVEPVTIEYQDYFTEEDDDRENLFGAWQRKVKERRQQKNEKQVRYRAAQQTRQQLRRGGILSASDQVMLSSDFAGRREWEVSSEEEDSSDSEDEESTNICPDTTPAYAANEDAEEWARWLAEEDFEENLHPAVDPNEAGVKFFTPAEDLACNGITCPIHEPHAVGPWYHKNDEGEPILGDPSHPVFKGSNPPPEVWNAYEQILEGKATEDEHEAVGGFLIWHVPPFWHTGPEGTVTGDATSGFKMVRVAQRH